MKPRTKNQDARVWRERETHEKKNSIMHHDCRSFQVSFLGYIQLGLKKKKTRPLVPVFLKRLFFFVCFFFFCTPINHLAWFLFTVRMISTSFPLPFFLKKKGVVESWINMFD